MIFVGRCYLLFKYKGKAKEPKMRINIGYGIKKLGLVVVDNKNMTQKSEAV